MERLKQLREEKNLYQKDVASYLGVDRTTYVKYETGSSEPNVDMLNKLAKFFNTSVDYILGNTDDPTPVDTKKGPSLEELASANKDIKEAYDILVQLPQNVLQQAGEYLEFLLQKEKQKKE